MSKQLRSVLRSLLTCFVLTETLTVGLQNMLAQVTKTITDSLERTVRCVSTRVDSLEVKLDGLDKLPKAINDSFTDSLKVIQTQVNALE